MKKKLGKKGAFETINAGMLSFISFVLITILVIMLISVVKQTPLVCDTQYDENTGNCYLNCNASHSTWMGDGRCSNETTNTASSQNVTMPFGGTDAYNGTLDMQEAAFLPPQFAEIIVIALVIIGIVGMLMVLGFGTYQKMKR